MCNQSRLAGCAGPASSSAFDGQPGFASVAQESASHYILLLLLRPTAITNPYSLRSSLLHTEYGLRRTECKVRQGSLPCSRESLALAAINQISISHGAEGILQTYPGIQVSYEVELS